MKPLSTRSLKILTTGLLLAALMLMLCGPWVIKRPRGLSQRGYLERIAAYGGILGVCAVAAGFSAFAILRREQEFYREQAKDNLQSLLESTRQDYLRKKSAESDQANAHADDV